MKFYRLSLTIILALFIVNLSFNLQVSAQEDQFASTCGKYSRFVMEEMNKYLLLNARSFSFTHEGKTQTIEPYCQGDEDWLPAGAKVGVCVVRYINGTYTTCTPDDITEGSVNHNGKFVSDIKDAYSSNSRSCAGIWDHYFEQAPFISNIPIECRNAEGWENFIRTALENPNLGYIDDVLGDTRCNSGEAVGLNLALYEGESAGELNVQVSGCIIGTNAGGNGDYSLYYFLDGSNSGARRLGPVSPSTEGGSNISTTFTGVNVRGAQSIEVCVAYEGEPSDKSGMTVCSGNYETLEAQQGGGSGPSQDAEDDGGMTGGLSGSAACQYSSDPQTGAFCRACIENKGTWTALGCILTTPEGIFAFLIRIAIGVMGGLALIRMIYLGYLYQTKDEGKIKEARQGVISTIAAIFVVIFSIVILRVIGVNILDVVPAGFFG